MCQYYNEQNSLTEFFQDVIVQKDHRIEELEELVDDLRCHIRYLASELGWQE